MTMRQHFKLEALFKPAEMTEGSKPPFPALILECHRCHGREFTVYTRSLTVPLRFQCARCESVFWWEPDSPNRQPA